MLNYITQALSQKLAVTLHLSTGQSLDIRSIKPTDTNLVECESSSSSSLYLIREDQIVFVETNPVI